MSCPLYQAWPNSGRKLTVRKRGMIAFFISFPYSFLQPSTHWASSIPLGAGWEEGEVKSRKFLLHWYWSYGHVFWLWEMSLRGVLCWSLGRRTSPPVGPWHNGVASSLPGFSTLSLTMQISVINCSPPFGSAVQTMSARLKPRRFLYCGQTPSPRLDGSHIKGSSGLSKASLLRNRETSPSLLHEGYMGPRAYPPPKKSST